MIVIMRVMLMMMGMIVGARERECVRVARSGLISVIVLIFVIMPVTMTMTMTVTVVVMTTAAQQPRAHNVDRQPEAGDRDGFGEVYRDWLEQAGDRFITYQDGNHRQHDGARKTRQVAEFACAETEPRIARVPSGIAVGKRR